MSKIENSSPSFRSVYMKTGWKDLKGNCVVLFRKGEHSVVKVKDVDPERCEISFEVMVGSNKGESRIAEYSEDSTVDVYAPDKAILAILSLDQKLKA